MNESIQRFSELEWSQVSATARQKLIDDGEKRVRLLELAQGFQEQEWCQRGHTGYIIGGTLDVEFQSSGESNRYQAGDPLMISPGEAHKARVENAQVLLFLVDDV